MSYNANHYFDEITGELMKDGCPALTSLLINAQSGDYTLVLSDAGKHIQMTKGTATTLTVPPNASVAFAIGTVIEGSQYGAGQVTITPGSGVTLRSSGGKLKSSAQYAAFGLLKLGANEWLITGDLST